ncbi:hypothetical protein LCGC14_2254540 [marine sediment metagenome]|uniref:Uncharacterized protein n=1 Tax=marine sediment metagenome TaxID=412755 RepID=A0A0F9DP14_9ZZZZ
MARKRLVDIEWDETSGVDHSANGIEGWAMLKGKTVHHGKVLQQIKELASAILARMDDDDDDESMTKATAQKALLHAVQEAWPAYASAVATIVAKHGKTEHAAGPMSKAFAGFREDVERRMAKLQGTMDSVRSALQSALNDKYPADDEDEGGAYHMTPWVRDFDDDSVVYEHDDKLYAAPYEINDDDDGDAKLGEAVRVRITYTPI